MGQMDLLEEVGEVEEMDRQMGGNHHVFHGQNTQSQRMDLDEHGDEDDHEHGKEVEVEVEVEVVADENGNEMEYHQKHHKIQIWTPLGNDGDDDDDDAEEVVDAGGQIRGMDGQLDLHVQQTLRSHHEDQIHGGEVGDGNAQIRDFYQILSCSHEMGNVVVGVVEEE